MGRMKDDVRMSDVKRHMSDVRCQMLDVDVEVKGVAS
jgi:hypothetical protein